MEHNEILQSEVAGRVVDDEENVPMQEGGDYSTPSSENNYSTSVHYSPLIWRTCSVFLGLELSAVDLDVKYNSDGNKPPLSACGNIDASEEAVLDRNDLDKLTHKGTKDLSIFVYISVH